VFNLGTKKAIWFATLGDSNFPIHDSRESVQSKKSPLEERTSRRDLAECLEFDKDLVDQDGMVKVAKLGIFGESGDVVESRTLSDTVFVPDRDDREVGSSLTRSKRKARLCSSGSSGFLDETATLGRFSMVRTRWPRRKASEVFRGNRCADDFGSGEKAIGRGGRTTSNDATSLSSSATWRKIAGAYSSQTSRSWPTICA
jgi:hypothetical protein